jgi:hypothetical protein
LFSIEVEAGPWLGYEPTYDIEENKMHESDDDQLDLLGEYRDNIDLLKSQFKSCKYSGLILLVGL